MFQTFFYYMNVHFCIRLEYCSKIKQRTEQTSNICSAFVPPEHSSRENWLLIKDTTKDKDYICITVIIPHGRVHRHPAPTPGTPRAPWPGSTPGIGWPPGGRRPGSAGGCPDTKHIDSERSMSS